MDAEEYQDVLRMHLLPFLSGGRRRAYTFQQDNATVHVASSTKSWFNRHHIRLMDWPACSPDLNPIENLWGILARRVYANARQYSSVAELETAVRQAWDSIESSTLKNLVDGMQRRIFEVIYNKGGPTKY
ncbi:hypothetical protein Y032_0193g1383 [Ancylostoma ceylanicum]|uniref:Tc1-like transposase DDE domain-containing protein n=1 Tax=Ancylostoma ceylanicum TaxID=53326 RepID=A0A016SQ41_9BILA|nr:hypothetical protein Y032_0193g1383 [Ancylostoma ceylanicum]